MTATPIVVPEVSRVGASDVRDWLTDAAFIVVLGTLGLYGLGPVYGGWQYLAIGVVGLLLGVTVAGLTARRHTPILLEVVVAATVFFVVGGILATREGGIIGRLSGLGHAGIYGWKELLTTSPPVGNSGNLLAIPYLLGLVGAIVGMSLARRTDRILLPVLGPFGVLAIGILFGPFQPTSLLLQGCVFGSIALVWMAVRYHRSRTVIAGTAMDGRRALTAVAIVVVISLLAGLVGPWLPGARSHQRTVLARYVVPPFDVSSQASPLSSFRQYAKGGGLNDKILFTVKSRDGSLPSRVRIAVMDSYNGYSWGFGSPDSGGATEDAFQKFGGAIPAPPGGSVHSVTITMGALGGIWMPEVGHVSSLAFNGPNSAKLNSAFRYDIGTATAAQPVGLAPGDTYTFLEADSSSTTGCAGQVAAGATGLEVSGVPQVFATDAQSWGATSGQSANSACAKFDAIATQLRNGKYSDGQPTQQNYPSPSLPGHGSGRLDTFLQGGGWIGSQIVGDDEQYAAAMALLGDEVGVPTRVVLGAKVEPSGAVYGNDVHAWVEADLAGVGWTPVYETSFMGTQPPTQTPPSPQQNAPTSAVVQPPPASSVRTPLLDPPPGFGDSHGVAHPPPGSVLPGWIMAIINWVILPLVCLALLAVVIRGLKYRRRRRRRSSGSPSERLAGAWNELVDRTRDLGGKVPERVTRREQAACMPIDAASGLATGADRGVFGPGDPSGSEIEEYWKQVESAMSATSASLTRWQRLRASVSLRSFFPGTRFTAGVA